MTQGSGGLRPYQGQPGHWGVPPPLEFRFTHPSCLSFGGGEGANGPIPPLSWRRGGGKWSYPVESD